MLARKLILVSLLMFLKKFTIKVVSKVERKDWLLLLELAFLS